MTDAELDTTRGARDQTARWPVVLVVPLLLVVACYVIATPRNGGPDEPSHSVYSAAVVRGDWTGDEFPGTTAARRFEVPAMVGQPDPGCWAQQPFVPAGCASLASDSTAPVDALSRSADYAPWTFVLPGLASFAPSASAYVYLARVLMAAIPLTLLAVSIAKLQPFGRGVRSAALLGVTPIAWFSMSIVNPSAVAIAGGLALWVALVARRHERSDVFLMCAWAAILLARRDGPLWATLIVIAVCLATSIEPRSLWQSLAPWAKATAVGLALLPVATMLVTDTSAADAALSLTPLSLVVAAPVTAGFRRSTRPGLFVSVAVAMVLVALATVVVLVRPGGFEAQVLRLVMSNTGEHLRQLVGVLSWLDAPVPTFAVLLFWASIGALIAVARLDRSRSALVGLGSIATTVVVAWVLELGQGADYGRYWQGRYSIPFTIGLPLLLALRTSGGRVVRSASVDSLATPIAAIAWIVWNAGFLAALQRWGVGLGGSWWPWDWDTWGAPVPPVALIVVHGAATAWLAAAASVRSA